MVTNLSESHKWIISGIYSAGIIIVGCALACLTVSAFFLLLCGIAHLIANMPELIELICLVIVKIIFLVCVLLLWLGITVHIKERFSDNQ